VSGTGRPRVGILHFTAPPIVGGVEAIVGEQANGLLRRGFDVTVLAGRGGRFRRDVSFVNLPALDSKYPPLLAVNEQLRAGLVSAEFSVLADQLERALASELADLDVCIVHNAMTLHFNLPLTAALHRLAAAGQGCPLVAWCHDLSWSNPLYQALMHEAFPWTLLKQRAAGALYVVVSEDRRRDLAELAGIEPAELAVIPAGVDLVRKLALGAATRRLLAEDELLAGDPFILLPIRITRRKNIELAIEIVAALRNNGWRPKLLVTGPRGPHDPASIRYVRELQSTIERCAVADEVVLLQVDRGGTHSRWRPTDRMMDELYRAADLMLLPSAQEGFGIPVLEAGLVGLPIFCSDIPPFREIAGEWVKYFRLDEPPQSIAQRLGSFLSGDERYQLRKRVARDFDWDAIFDRQLVPLLQAAVNGMNRCKQAVVCDTALP
jgi:mannosylglucosylglycerate synthase